MNSEEGNSHTNPEIGRMLERARAERGLSLWQVEQATKIRARYLHDLEQENFDVLPAVYVLGSLKTYADYLGLDGEALVRELKDRQAPPPEEPGPTPEEPTQSERGGFLAALGSLPVIGGRDAVEDDEDAGSATVLGYGPSLYLGLGAVLILVLTALALGSAFGDGGQPAISQVSEPTISDAPSRIAFSGDAQDGRDDETTQDASATDGRPGEQARSPDDGDEKDKKVAEKDQAEKSDRDDEDDAQPAEDAGDVAINLPTPSTASASTASAGVASASASSTATASATSTPVATASAVASSAATAPASSPPVAAPAATAPETANPGVAPGPTRVKPAAAGQPAPGAARAPAGGRQAGVADRAQPVKRIVGKVRIVRTFVR